MWPEMLIIVMLYLSQSYQRRDVRMYLLIASALCHLNVPQRIYTFMNHTF